MNESVNSDNCNADDCLQWRNASKSIEHTAHVLLALSKCGDSLTGKLKVQASNARLLAIRYYTSTRQ